MQKRTIYKHSIFNIKIFFIHKNSVDIPNCTNSQVYILKSLHLVLTFVNFSIYRLFHKLNIFLCLFSLLFDHFLRLMNLLQTLF